MHAVGLVFLVPPGSPRPPELCCAVGIHHICIFVFSHISRPSSSAEGRRRATPSAAARRGGNAAGSGSAFLREGP